MWVIPAYCYLAFKVIQHSAQNSTVQHMYLRDDRILHLRSWNAKGGLMVQVLCSDKRGISDSHLSHICYQVPPGLPGCVSSRLEISRPRPGIPSWGRTQTREAWAAEPTVCPGLLHLAPPTRRTGLRHPDPTRSPAPPLLWKSLTF